MSETSESFPFRQDIFRARDVIEECERQAVRPQDDDPYLAAMAAASATLLREPTLAGIMNIAIDLRREERPTPLNMFNVLRCAVQKQLIRYHGESYPQAGFDRSERVEETLRTLLDDATIQDEMQFDVGLRRVQTNIGERYKSHKIIMALLENRLGIRPTFLDIGCSDMQGPKQLHFANVVPFGFISERDSSDKLIQTDTTFWLNRLVRSYHGVPGQVVGIDEASPESESNLEWIRACTFKPAELARRERVEAFDTLHRLHDSQLYGYWHAFDAARMARFADEAPVDRFKVATFTTSLSQLDESDAENKRQLVRHYLDPEGIIIYQDRFAPDPYDQSKLRFLPHFNQYNYRTLLEFAADPSHTLYEVLQWENGRCHTVKPGPYLDDLLEGRLG